MSQKNLRKKKQAARSTPAEAIVTRFKSSQSQQSKVSIDQNENKCNKYSKTYARTRKSAAKCDKDKQEKEQIETENKEFYPDKLKRSLLKKQIVLAPKPAYKLVGGLSSFNKRKMSKPVKETGYVEEDVSFTMNQNEDLSNSRNVDIIDLICIDDDSDSLDEEDLMEILTCPSPVWWEDPPNEFYDEEPLSVSIDPDSRITSVNQNVNDTSEEHVEEKCKVLKYKSPQNNNMNLIKDNNFVARRNKLVSLLGAIKKRKAMNNRLQNAHCSGSTFSSPALQKKPSESLGEELLDEENLKTLENIEIPIGDPKQKPSTVKVDEPPLYFKGLNEKTKVTYRKVGKKSKTVKRGKVTIKKCDIKQLGSKIHKKEILMTRNKVQNVKTVEKNNSLLLKTWSEQCGGNELSHCNKTDVNQSEPSQAVQNEVSALPITDFDQNMVTKNTKPKNGKNKDVNKIISMNEISKKVAKLNSCLRNSTDLEQVTVYKILSDDTEESKEPKLESSKTYNTQLNSYYNQCKNITKSKKETLNDRQMGESDVDITKKTVKSIPVSSDETVKYCLQCSCIFDSDACNYCDLKSNEKHKLGSNKANLKTVAS